MTKDTDEPKKQAEEAAVVAEQPESQPVPQDSHPVVPEPQKPKKSQTILTVAIASAVVLFFAGLGLGYLLGHSALDGDSDFRGGNLQLPGNGDGGRRFYPNSGTDDGTNNNSGSSSSTTPQTQTN